MVRRSLGVGRPPWVRPTVRRVRCPAPCQNLRLWTQSAGCPVGYLCATKWSAQHALNTSLRCSRMSVCGRFGFFRPDCVSKYCVSRTMSGSMCAGCCAFAFASVSTGVDLPAGVAGEDAFACQSRQDVSLWMTMHVSLKHCDMFVSHAICAQGFPTRGFVRRFTALHFRTSVNRRRSSEKRLACRDRTTPSTHATRCSSVLRSRPSQRSRQLAQPG